MSFCVLIGTPSASSFRVRSAFFVGADGGIFNWLFKVWAIYSAISVGVAVGLTLGLCLFSRALLISAVVRLLRALSLSSSDRLVYAVVLRIASTVLVTLATNSCASIDVIDKN